MTARPHKLFDHQILGYFILFIFAEIMISLGGIIDNAISGFIPGYAVEITVSGQTIKNAMGIGNAVGALAAVAIFKLWFRPDFRGCLGRKYLRTVLLMMLPFLLLHYIGSAVSWFTGGTGSVIFAFLRALSPGFGEEVAFRGLGIANFMRTIKSEKQIKTIFWLSSIFFGLFHLMNIFAGGDPVSSAFQAVYAIGVGMMFGAVYLRTGNLWPVMIGHMSLDFLELVRGDLGATVVMKSLSAGDWITMAAAVVGAVLALRLISPDHYPEIIALWNEKWSGNSGE